jgi:hypothetical protein
MRNRKITAQALAALGSVLLLVSAALHGTLGYQGIVTALSEKAVDPTAVAALKAIWLIVSWHWIAIALLVPAVLFGRAAPRKVILVICGLAVIGDAVAGYSAIGLFIGDELLAVAGLAILSAAALFPAPTRE